MNNDTTQTAPSAKLQASVDYLPGVTIAGSQSALLEWGADDRIRFFIMDATTGKAEKVLFDVALSEIERVGGGFTLLTIVVGGKKYNAQFSRTATVKLGIGGGVGLGAAYADVAASGINLWVDKFRENNVSVRGFKGANWVMKAALVGTAACIGIAVIVVIIVMIATVANPPTSPY